MRAARPLVITWCHVVCDLTRRRRHLRRRRARPVEPVERSSPALARVSGRWGRGVHAVQRGGAAHVVTVEARGSLGLVWRARREAAPPPASPCQLIRVEPGGAGAKATPRLRAGM